VAGSGAQQLAGVVAGQLANRHTCRGFATFCVDMPRIFRRRSSRRSKSGCRHETISCKRGQPRATTRINGQREPLQTEFECPFGRAIDPRQRDALRWHGVGKVRRGTAAEVVRRAPPETRPETRRSRCCQLSTIRCVGHTEHFLPLARLSKAPPTRGINTHNQSCSFFPAPFRAGFRWWMPVVHAQS
jgi:hypothetical protein